MDSWWVSSFNRSKKTPYIIHHRLGVDTVYADQSTNSSQWVELGEYEFNGKAEDMVMISNFGGDSFNYVVADAIRWVGLDEELTSNESNLSGDSRTLPTASGLSQSLQPQHSNRIYARTSGLRSIRVL